MPFSSGNMSHRYIQIYSNLLQLYSSVFLLAFYRICVPMALLPIACDLTVQEEVIEPIQLSLFPHFIVRNCESEGSSLVHDGVVRFLIANWIKSRLSLTTHFINCYLKICLEHFFNSWVLRSWTHKRKIKSSRTRICLWISYQVKFVEKFIMRKYSLINIKINASLNIQNR